MNNKKGLEVLLIAPHQDDESIGCGGLLARLQPTKHTTFVQHIFGGYSNVSGAGRDESSRIRLSETQKCSTILGFQLLENFGFRDREYTTEGQVIKALIELFHRIQPDVVLCPHSNESDYEHRIVHTACKEALWLSKVPGFREYKIHNEKNTILLCYEVWTPIQHPALYIDISEYREAKERAINAHYSQVAGTDWGKGALGLNAYRGTTSQGTGYFEAFEAQKLTGGQVNILNTLLNA